MTCQDGNCVEDVEKYCEDVQAALEQENQQTTRLSLETKMSKQETEDMNKVQDTLTWQKRCEHENKPTRLSFRKTELTICKFHKRSYNSDM